MVIAAARPLKTAALLALAALAGAAQEPAAPACQREPESPTGLTAPAVTATAVVLRWNPVPAGPGCRVTYAVSDHGEVVASGLTGPTATLTHLDPGSVHFLYVTARNQAGTSLPASGLAVRTRTTAACTAPPDVPTGLASTRRTGTSVALAWAPVQVPQGCSVSYLVYQDGRPVLTVPTTTAVLDGLAPGTGHTVAVAAVDDHGVSAPSPALPVRTAPAAGGPGPAQVLGHPGDGPDRPVLP